MSRLLRFILSVAVVLSVLVTAAPATPVMADSISTSFDSFTLGNVNGQDGWSKTGPFDVAVVANTYGFTSFGSQSLRISDAVTSGSLAIRPLLSHWLMPLEKQPQQPELSRQASSKLTLRCNSILHQHNLANSPACVSPYLLTEATVLA